MITLYFSAYYMSGIVELKEFLGCNEKFALHKFHLQHDKESDIDYKRNEEYREIIVSDDDSWIMLSIDVNRNKLLESLMVNK